MSSSIYLRESNIALKAHKITIHDDLVYYGLWDGVSNKVQLQNEHDVLVEVNVSQSGSWYLAMIGKPLILFTI